MSTDNSNHSSFSASDWVRLRGVAPVGPLSERVLTGGVSSLVVAVEGPDEGVVVKRALATLRVQGEWHADPRRSILEARALRAMRHITPKRVPRVLDLDSESSTLVMELAPREAENWRSQLLNRPADPMIGRELGSMLAAWHRRTWTPWPEAITFADGATQLEELRLRPFHERIAGRFASISPAVNDIVEELRSQRWCLVHGDFSPKNVLIADRFMWVIDPEVAHIGNPVLDIAFLGTHLVLAAIARPGFAASVESTWAAFVDEYARYGPTMAPDDRLAVHIGCLLLSRTDGLSPEPGLTASQVQRVRQLGLDLILGRRITRSIVRIVTDAVV